MLYTTNKQRNYSDFIRRFLLMRDLCAFHRKAALRIALCLSVRPSVCLIRYSSSQKWQKLRKVKLRCNCSLWHVALWRDRRTNSRPIFKFSTNIALHERNSKSESRVQVDEG